MAINRKILKMRIFFEPGPLCIAIIIVVNVSFVGFAEAFVFGWACDLLVRKKKRNVCTRNQTHLLCPEFARALPWKAATGSSPIWPREEDGFANRSLINSCIVGSVVGKPCGHEDLFFFGSFFGKDVHLFEGNAINQMQHDIVEWPFVCSSRRRWWAHMVWLTGVYSFQVSVLLSGIISLLELLQKYVLRTVKF